MFDELKRVLTHMESAFSRQATYGWFVIVFVGFLVRTDTLGVSSIVRALMLAPESYTCLLPGIPPSEEERAATPGFVQRRTNSEHARRHREVRQCSTARTGRAATDGSAARRVACPHDGRTLSLMRLTWPRPSPFTSHPSSKYRRILSSSRMPKQSTIAAGWPVILKTSSGDNFR